MEQGHVEEAEEVYREDIKLWKDNMWGLLGLKLCLEERGDTSGELESVTALFNERSARATIVPAKPASVLKMHSRRVAVTELDRNRYCWSLFLEYTEKLRANQANDRTEYLDVVGVNGLLK